MENNYTIQDVFLKFGASFIKENKLSTEQWKVFNAILNCKTKELGYHTITCEECGETIKGYNSCRNRHCPMCQNYAREKWIKKENENLLDCPYFHIVTTIPIELNDLVLYNKKIMYNILFKATSESILELANDSKWLGAKVGITSILHTWGQTMELHPHIHSIVTGGGIKDNQWINSKENYLFKVQVLSSLFKGKFLGMLKKEKIIFPKKLKHLNEEKVFNKFLEILYKKQWITYIEPPKGSPENVIEYIGRYSFRIAISNYRIKNITNEDVTFEYKDYKDNGNIKLMTITGIEFIRRFLMHVLPDYFTKIKHYGLFTNRNKKALIELCRNLIKKLNFNTYIRKKHKRKLYELTCQKCGNNKFIYSYYYSRPDINRRLLAISNI